MDSVAIPIRKGWNLIGSHHLPVAVTDVISQPDSILGSFYQYTGGTYTLADSIRPGRAYWVKTSYAGTLTLISPALIYGGLP